MSLLSTDLRTVKKLSLKGVRLPIKDKERSFLDFGNSYFSTSLLNYY
jgi:hypothetical protein